LCSGNGEIDARVFSYSQRNTEVRGSDNKSKIVETRPTDKTTVSVGVKAYVSRAEAPKEMAIVCKD